MSRIALFAPLPPEAVAGRFADAEVVGIGPDDDAAELAAGATVAVADWSGRVRITSEIVDALAPTCRLVQVPAAGLDSVDVDACVAARIPVAACAGLNTDAVAEWCVWGAIDALRRLSWSQRALHAGRWEQLGHVRYELAGKTVGIVGLGAIGTAAAERFRAFGVELRYWSRRRRGTAEEERLGIAWNELDELVAAADVLVLAVALTPETEQLIGRDRLAAMKASAVLVNAARGRVVDEAALAEALREGRLHGAAVDAFAEEPVPADHPLLTSEHAVLTPHVGGASAEAVGRIMGRVFANVRAALDGRPVEGLVG